MKTAVFTAIFFLLCLSVVWAQGAAEPFAVVELFGSEGCSSCPPADDFLRALTKESRASGSKVYPLSFHVDYWNYLGWPDPYSAHEFTERQYMYGKVLHADVYTPQMVINGMDAFVGADRGTAKKLITRALKTPASNTINLEIANSGSQDIEVSYRCGSVLPNTVVNVALVERGLASQVTRGENAGRTLEHDNVVRQFKTVPLSEQAGTVRLAKPASADLSKFSVVAYVQDTQNLKIIAAGSVDL